MTIFVKWFIINAIIITGLILAQTLILCVFIGLLCFNADLCKKKADKEAIIRKSDIGWFCAEHFFSLGLLGTIIGLCIATGDSLTDSDSVSQIVAGLKHGLNTAFYTTICGITLSLFSQIQLLVLKRGLEK
jgi:hypothetical protein